MKPQRLLRAHLLIGAALLFAACAPINVTTYTARGADVTRYATFAWDRVDTAVPGDPRLDNNAFFHEYVRDAIERQLLSHGYEPTILPEPDLRIHYHASAAQRVYVSGTETRYDTCVGDCRVQVYDEGTLLIDLVDARTGVLVWRGTARPDLAGAVHDQKRMEETIERAVARMFDTLPPRG